MEKIIIIAEIGECFNGEMEQAERLIRSAAGAGCDVAKFQTLDFESIAENDPESQWFKKVALDPGKIARLVKYARITGIDILFTPENIKTARWLLDAGMSEVKIASSSVGDYDYIHFVGENFKRVYMSTGMASMDEVNSAVKSLSKVPELYIMHCISEYPTGPLLDQRGLVAMGHGDVRLSMMRMLMELFPQFKIGYSDHTSGILAPVAAAAMGAAVIEKHITLDRETPVRNFRTGGEYQGTDHVLSIEPLELKEMVSMIREVEKMIGPWRWERSEGEKLLREFLRGRFS